MTAEPPAGAQPHQEVWTEQAYWDAVRAIGIRDCKRVPGLDTDWIGINRSGSIASVPDPQNLTPEQRKAAIDGLRLVHEEFGH